MKAIVWTDFGTPDVLQLREAEKPAPKENEVLIRIYATTVTMGDCEQRSMKLPLWYRLPLQAYVGFRRPVRVTILGMDLAGEIEAVGREVKLFSTGDQVFGSSGIRFSANAEYICLPEEPFEGALGIKPVNMTYEEAAAIPVGGIEALHFLRQGNVHDGQKVLINGAGGTIGPFAIQLAKHFGAEVTAVDSTEKLDMLQSIGADHVIDFTREDFNKSGKTYDFILDLVRTSSFSGSLKSLDKNGCYLIANPGLSQMVRRRWNSIKNSLLGLKTGKQVIFGATSPKNEDLIALRELIEAGKIKSIIDKVYPLEKVPEAHRYVETGQKQGQVVITVAHSNKS